MRGVIVSLQPSSTELKGEMKSQHSHAEQTLHIIRQTLHVIHQTLHIIHQTLHIIQE